MKTIYFLFLMIIPIAANAQLSKGMKQVGGSLSISFRDSDIEGQNSVLRQQSSERNFFVSPQIGYFVKDNLSIGFSMGFSNSRITFENNVSESDDKITSNTFTISLFSRYHYSLSDNIYLFIEPSIRGGLGNINNNTVENGERRIRSVGFLGYSYEKTTPENDSISAQDITRNEFELDLSTTTLEIGFQYYF